MSACVVSRRGSGTAVVAGSRAGTGSHVIQAAVRREGPETWRPRHASGSDVRGPCRAFSAGREARCLCIRTIGPLFVGRCRAASPLSPLLCPSQHPGRRHRSAHPQLTLRRACSAVVETLKAAQKVDPARKCFRLIGGVLVERSVADVVPALEANLTSVSPRVRSKRAGARDRIADANMPACSRSLSLARSSSSDRSWRAWWRSTRARRSSWRRCRSSSAVRRRRQCSTVQTRQGPTERDRGG